MNEVDAQTEQLIDSLSEEILNQKDQTRWVSEAIFVMALDLKQNPSVNLKRDYPDLESAITEVWNNQPDWIIDELQSRDLPSGFSQSASDGEADIVDLSDPVLNHEFLMYPGDDFVEVLIRDYYPLICGEYSLQSITEKTRIDKNGIRDGMMLIIGSMGSSGLPVVPLFGLLVLELIERNIDQVCEKYDPY